MRKLYIFLALVFIVVAILFFPVQLPEEETAPERQESVMNLSESYPEHPKTLEDCENTSKRDFCIGDAAEMTNNIGLCYEINSPEIKVFCIARISLNETMCEDIQEEGLKEACSKSIAMKKEWLDIE